MVTGKTYLAALAFGAALVAAVGQARAVEALFTTASDFGLWTSTPGGPTTVTPGSLDFDGNPLNGLANAAPGVASPGGSLQVVTRDIQDTVFTVDLSTNASFMSAIDPGWVPGQTVAYTGPMSIIYTVPTTANDTGFNLGLNLAYTADGFYDDTPAIQVLELGTINGLQTREAIFQYTIQPGALNEFRFRVAYNSSSTLTSPFYIDAVYVPEPGLAMAIAPLAGLAIRRRSHRR